MNIKLIFIIFSFLSVESVRGEQLTIVVNRTEIEPNYEFVNCTVNLKIDQKAQKYGIDIDVDLRNPIKDFIVSI